MARRFIAALVGGIALCMAGAGRVAGAETPSSAHGSSRETPGGQWAAGETKREPSEAAAGGWHTAGSKTPPDAPKTARKTRTSSGHTPTRATRSHGPDGFSPAGVKHRSPASDTVVHLSWIDSTSSRHTQAEVALDWLDSPAARTGVVGEQRPGERRDERLELEWERGTTTALFWEP